jgi:hypothetical protein
MPSQTQVEALDDEMSYEKNAQAGPPGMGKAKVEGNDPVVKRMRIGGR